MKRCRYCRKPLGNEKAGYCPHCGEPTGTRAGGVMKTRAILISAGGTETVYRSIKEVPPRLRSRLVESTNSLNAATVVIADKNGRAEIARAIRRLSSAAQRKRLHALIGDEGEGARYRISPELKKAAALVLAILCLALVALLFRN